MLSARWMRLLYMQYFPEVENTLSPAFYVCVFDALAIILSHDMPDSRHKSV